jgi:hypothetical protein
MKVYSLYYKDNFVAAFSSREEAVSYGKIHYSQESWDCDIVVEYLHKSPISYIPPYSAPYHITPNTTIPCTQPIIPKVPDTSPNVWCGTQDNMGTVTATYNK